MMLLDHPGYEMPLDPVQMNSMHHRPLPLAARISVHVMSHPRQDAAELVGDVRVVSGCLRRFLVVGGAARVGAAAS